MKRIQSLLITVVFLLVAVAGVQAGEKHPTAEFQCVEMATDVLHQMMASPEAAIPKALLDRAQAVAVVPHVVKKAVGIGMRHGEGLLTQRTDSGAWGSPIFVSVSGVSYGDQDGPNATDIILVFTGKAGIEGILEGDLKLGGDAPIVAGPVGRATDVAADQTPEGAVYAYSRSKGSFSGVALHGAVLTIDSDANVTAYGEKFDAKSTLSRKKAPEDLNGFLEALALQPMKQS